MKLTNQIHLYHRGGGGEVVLMLGSHCTIVQSAIGTDKTMWHSGFRVAQN